jgi:esterase/lipase superfamily enzyme
MTEQSTPNRDEIIQIVKQQLEQDAQNPFNRAAGAWESMPLGFFYGQDAAAAAGVIRIVEILAARVGLPLTVQNIGWTMPVNLSTRIADLVNELEGALGSGSETDLSHHRQVMTPRGRGASSAASDFAMARILFATDRQIELGTSDAVSFGSARSRDGLHYGECEVAIPDDHRLGTLETPSWLRLEFTIDPRKHVALIKTTAFDELGFLARLSSSQESSGCRDLLVFIHGYNVSFEDAARRTAQLAWDLKFVGAPILYSWPSTASLLRYTNDEANAIWTVPHLEAFLTLLGARRNVERIHLIAHSMGSRTLCDAFRALSFKFGRNGQPSFRHLMLTAPDIDTDTFSEIAQALVNGCERVTLYASSTDRALRVSKLIHGYPRAGDLLVIVPGVDTIDASSVDTSLLGHSFFGTSRSVIADMHALLRDGRPPAERFGMRLLTHAGRPYYAFQP